jgi:hypothetical protein
MSPVYLPQTGLCSWIRIEDGQRVLAIGFEGVARTVSLSGASPRGCFINLKLFQTPRKYLTN